MPAEDHQRLARRGKAAQSPAPMGGALSATPAFAEAVITWQRGYGRQSLPWQHQRDAYRVWLSEVMLQQTQVATVLGYYERFLQDFPNVRVLAAADIEQVLQLWSGLGYYSRARNLHACARQVVERFDGAFPEDPEQLASLPGIGRSTAAAIAAFAFGRRAAILDGNVKRVFCRYFGVEGFPGERRIESALWDLAEQLLPQQGIEAYTQGLMDLGATVCTRSRPVCLMCPLSAGCVARSSSRIDELPFRKPAKSRPTRHAALLVVRDGSRVLVHRRPPSGIWGGLWSLPEIELQPDTGQQLVELEGSLPPALAELGPRAGVDSGRLALAVTEQQRLPAFLHMFSHYTLRAMPLLLELAPLAASGAPMLSASPVSASAPPASKAPASNAPANVPSLAASVLVAHEPDQWRWLAQDEIASAALPSPIKTLLTALAESR